MKRRLLGWLLLLVIAGIAFFYWLTQSAFIQRRIYPLKYREEIINFSKENNLDPYLTMGIIWVESKFKPEATSHKGAKGLMQIVPPTGEWIANEMGIKEYDHEMLYDPQTNIMFGCWYFAYLLKVFDGDISLALISYNGGMGNVIKWLKDPQYSEDGKHLKDVPFDETRKYLKRVIDAQKQYKKLYEI
ncbi:MAG: lytic transglycosylase domain-containing protein [Clostridiales bacterium]|nr:lytic transglycosylase domain-containing protein [Clostridiales bacterium]